MVSDFIDKTGYSIKQIIELLIFNLELLKFDKFVNYLLNDL